MPNWSDWQAIPSDIMDASDNLQKASDWGDQQMQKVADMWAGKWNSFPLAASPAQAGGVTDPSSTGPLDSAPVPAPMPVDAMAGGWGPSGQAGLAQQQGLSGDRLSPDSQDAQQDNSPYTAGVAQNPAPYDRRPNTPYVLPVPNIAGPTGWSDIPGTSTPVTGQSLGNANPVQTGLGGLPKQTISDEGGSGWGGDLATGASVKPLATGTDPFQTKINNGPTLTRDETIKAGVSIGLTPDEAGYLWDKGVASNVDPGSALAIIKLEGNVHTANNNMFDIQYGDGVTPTPPGDDPRWGAFQSHQAAIDAFYTLINGRYVPNGQETIGTIMHGPGSTMDTTTTHAYAPIFENDKFYPQKVVDLVAGWHASGQEPISSESSGTADPSQTTAVPGRNPDGRAVATEDQRQFEKEAGLSDADAYSACGPVAAAAFAKTYGRNPTPQEAIQLAQSVGWTGGKGMAGVHSEQDLLQKMGVNTKLEEGQQFNWGDVQRDAMNGNPVIIDSPNHYFYVSNYDPQTGKYYVGNSGLVFAQGGKDWMTADEINAHGGGARAALFADHPTAEGPSITEQNPDAPDQKSTDQNPLSQAVNGFHDLTSLAAQKVQDAVNAFGQNMQNPDQSFASNPTSAALGFVGGMANQANQAAQQVSQPVTNQQLTDVNAPGNQAARSLSVMLGAGDTDVSLDAMQSMMKDAQAAWDAATTDFRQSPVGQQMQMQMRTLQAKISSATAQSNTVQAAPGTPEIPASGTHSTTGFQGMRLNPTDTNTAGAPQPETPTAPVPADVTTAQTAPTVPAGAPPPPIAPPTEAAQPIQQAAQRGVSDFYANNPPPVQGPAAPAGAPEPTPNPLPQGARPTISQDAYDAAVARIEQAKTNPDDAAAAHQQLDTLISQGADPGTISRFLNNDVEGRSIGPLDVVRTDRTGSMAGGVTSLGKVAANVAIQPIMRAPVAALDMAMSGRAGDIPTVAGGAMQGLADGARLALQTIRYGTNDEAALRGGAQGAYGYPAGLDVLGTNPVTRAAGAGLSGLVRLHGAAADLTSGMGRGAATAAGATPEEAAQAGAQWALRSGNYGFWGGKAAQVLDAVRGDQQAGGLPAAAGNLTAQIIMPFFRVAYNATTQGIERSPLGAAGTAFDVARAPLGSGPYAAGANANGAVTALQPRIINNAMGVGVAGAAFELASNGMLTGANPKNGAPAWSVQVAGNWVPLRSIPIAGESLAQAADLYEAFRDGRGDVRDTAMKVAQGYASHAADDTWLSSMADLFSEAKDIGTLANPKAKAYDVKGAQRDINYQGQSLVNSFIPQDRLASQAANSQGVTIPNQYIGKAQQGMTPLVGGSSNTSSGPSWQTQLANLRNSPAYKSASPAQQQKMIAQAQADFAKEPAGSR